MQNPTQFPRWIAKLGQVWNGQSDAKVLFIGDSTTWGAFGIAYPGNTTQGAYPAILSFVQSLGVSISNASATAYVNTSTDSRIALTGAFALSNLAAGFAHWCFSVNASGTLTFTPGDGVSYDRFDIYTQGGQGGGVLSATATGGAATPITQPFTNTVVKTTVNAGAAGAANSVAISWTSGNVQVIGVEAWLSTIKRVRFANVGFSGSSSSAWADNFTSLTAIKAWAPDLSIIMLGINDAQSATPVKTYLANLQSIVDAARISGDIIVMSPVPSDASLTLPVMLESQYASELATFAAYNGIGFIDIFNDLFGGNFFAPLMTNTLHPNPAGYFEIAKTVNTFLN